MIEKVNSNQLPDYLEQSSSMQQNSPKISGDNSQDASLHIDYDDLIEQALQTNQTDTDVQQAKELLLSGRLESPENFTQAAENILNFGV